MSSTTTQQARRLPILHINYNAGRGQIIRCRKAANVSGWITAVTEAGSIIRAWAGEFTVAGEENNT